MSKMPWIALLLFLGTLSARSVAEESDPPTVKEIMGWESDLQVIFNDPMLTWLGSSALANIVISPAWHCNWSWSSDTQLSCYNEAHEHLQPATEYRISLRGGLWSQQGQEIGQQDLRFETQRPSILDHGTIVDHWDKSAPIIKVLTSSPVFASSLTEALSLTEDGREIRFSVKQEPFFRGHRSFEKNTQWQLNYSLRDSAPHTLSLRLKPGLRTPKGPLPGVQDEVLLRALVNEPFGLRFVGCGGRYQEPSPTPDPISGFSPHYVAATGDRRQEITIDCPAGQPVSLAFSQPLSADSIDWLRSQLPSGLRYAGAASGGFRRYWGSDIEVLTRPSEIASLVSDIADGHYSLELPESLASAEGGQTGRHYVVKIRSTDFMPNLELTPAQLLLRPGSSLPPIVSTTNIPALNVTIKELGGGEFSTRAAVIPEAARNTVVQRSPPKPDRSISQRGGLVEGNLQHPLDPYFSPNTYAIAYAAFNVTASQTKNQALVWVTDWQGATPIANAKVELLRLTSPQSSLAIASARTGSDGVALFDLSGLSDAEARSYSLVRVTHRGKRSVAPFTNMLRSNWADRYEHQRPQLHEGMPTDWGVSDRPLYHPGDTVRYRLWIRERQLNRLHMLPPSGEVKVNLHGLNESAKTAEFSATPDKFGSVSGELTLPATARDGDYCISTYPQQYGLDNGVCFRVTNYRPKDLWATLEADRPVIREGDTLNMDAEAGYFSGGPAVGAKTEFQSLLAPMRLEQAYPEFRSFTFVDPFENTAGYDGESLTDSLQEPQFTGSEGHAKRAFTFRIPSVSGPAEEGGREPIPFGTLDLTVTVSTSASTWTTAPAALKFSRYPRFVGLRLTPWILRDDEDPEVEAVLITDSGKQIKDATITIDIEERIAGDEIGSEPGFRSIGQCMVPAGQPARCPFRPEHSGIYRFRAHSPGAATTLVERYASVGEKWKAPRTESKASLTTIDNSPAIGSTMELTLRQPFARAEVLVSVEHLRVLKYWVQHVDSPLARISVPVDKDWLPGVTINAVILDAESDAFGPHAVSGELVKMASLDIHPSGASGPVPVNIALDRNQARPGDRIQIRLHNPRAEAVQVTLGVVDDAVRELAREFTDAANPAGAAWLGKLDSWQLPTWTALGNWERKIGKSTRSPRVFTENYSLASSERLDTMIMTGSSLTAVDLFRKSQAVDRSLGRPASAPSIGSALRHQFMASPFWQSDIVMAPGSDRTFDVELPDNLTRWRVLAWAADDADGFALSEATVEASLPVEVRNEAPIRLFPGDQATVRSSVRSYGSDAQIDARLHVKGAGVDATNRWSEEIASNRQRTISLLAQPTETGQIAVEARASSNQVEDGIGAVIEVASPMIHETMPVAGWLPAEGVDLKLPALPAGAMQPKISIEISRGPGALVRSWADGLRDYPHANWEQILSRAVGAAIAVRLGFAETDWPDARSVVESALRDATRFQDRDGAFHFYVDDSGRDITPPSLMLTAYSVQSFALLRSLGYDIPAVIEKRANTALWRQVGLSEIDQKQPHAIYLNEEMAAALAVVNPDFTLSPQLLDAMWDRRNLLSWYGRANLARALDSRPRYAEQARVLVGELRLAGSRQGLSRSIQEPTGYGWPFESRTLDQCGVIQALSKLDHADDAAEIRDQYLRGLSDLYAGGMPTLDTQTRAQCMIALLDVMPKGSYGNVPVGVDVSTEDFSTRIELASGQPEAGWSSGDARLPRRLQLRANPAEDTLLSYLARIEYDLDGRNSQPAAIGFSLTRKYSVIRNHAWKDIPVADMREGDWVRVTLRLNTSRMRYFVAITDEVPGGLQPTDLELSSTVDSELLALATAVNPWFPAQRVDDRHARFYSEQLPPGTHEIHYYARATHSGRYAALPAVAELMYGNASVSRTAAATLVIEEANVDSAASNLKP